MPTTLEETGTKADPWQIDCLEDFLFLTTISVVSSKHIELNCDIFLNDEKFDKSGNPSGGDGVFYNWKGINLNNSTFDGNGYLIYGLYSEDLVKSNNVGLFLSVYKSTIRDFRLLGAFLYHGNTETDGGYGGYTGGLCRILDISVVKNVYIDANIYGSTIGGIAGYTNSFSEIYDCKIYINVEGNYVGGVVGIAFGSLDNESKIGNCEVHGKIVASYAGGVVCDVGLMNFSISHIKNYSNILSTGVCGGVVGRTNHKKTNLFLKDCVNYGSLITTNYFPAGMICAMDCNAYIWCCSNYGIIEGGTPAGIIGSIGNYGTNNNNIIEIDGCYIELAEISDKNKTVAMIGAMYNISYFNNHNDLIIKNTKINTKNCLATISNSIKFDKIELSNIEINISCSSSNSRLFGGAVGWSDYAKIKNILFVVNRKGTLPTRNNFIDDFGKPFDISSTLFVISGTNGQVLQYFGSDFSGFYVDYKTCKIGLKALSAKGFYQGKVTEEYLIGKGFEKKAI